MKMFHFNIYVKTFMNVLKHIIIQTFTQFCVLRAFCDDIFSLFNSCTQFLLLVILHRMSPLCFHWKTRIVSLYA